MFYARLALRATKLLLLGCLCGAVPAQAQDPGAADPAFSAISRLLAQADTALEQNETANAIRLYGATLRAWHRFAAQYPDFAPELVRFRMAYCQNQLEQLEALAAREVALAPPIQRPNQPAPPPTPPAGANSTVPADVLALIQAGTPQAIRQAAVDLGETPAGVYCTAAAFIADNDLPAARILMEALLESEPAQAAAHYNLAQLLLREDPPDMEQARAHYEQARALGAPQDPDLDIVLNVPMQQTDATIDRQSGAQP